LVKEVLRAAALVGASVSLCACLSQPRFPVEGSAPSGGGLHGTMQPYRIGGQWYYPAEQPHYDETGVASWYGDAYGCRVTADGEALDPAALTGAHKTLPLPSYVEVTNLENGRRLKVRINDRGPFVKGRIIDLTHAAALQLGFFNQGTVKVRVRYLGPAPLKPTETDWRPSGGGCR
jgi:rare lipoprotein A